MTLRALHRTSALVIGAFVLVHLANHLCSLAGVATHVAFMEVARKVYRHPVAETILLASAAFQTVSGLWLVARGWKQRRGGVAWLQALSGLTLAMFLMIHVSAVLVGRIVLNLDTNFHFAAAGFHVPPYQYFFAPYYFLAVLALFTHLGCAAYWQLQAASPGARKLALILPMAGGALMASLIVLSLAGKLQAVDVPEIYKASYPR